MSKKKIKALRKRLGLTQAGLARLVGVAPNTVARWERGESKPRLQHTNALKAVAEAGPAPVHTKEELVSRLSKALDLVPNLNYAVGGAEAMAMHGYERATADVDVYVLAEDLNAFMVALRQAGLETVSVFEPFHYAARLPGDPEFERRVDVLSPAGEPELSGIEYADFGMRYGRAWRVFPPDFLAATKFYAYNDSGDDRHKADMQAMYRRGIFDAAKVRKIVEFLGKEDLSAYDRVIRSFMPTPAKVGKKRKKRKKRARRLPRDLR